MIDTINEIFGASISEEAYLFPKGTPYYIKNGYTAGRLIWEGKDCLLVHPKDNAWRLPTLKKQIRAIEELCSLPVIVALGKMTSLQRTNLISSGVAFVSGTGQLFIPFWGCYFEAKIKQPALVPEIMTPNAQLIFLHLYYRYRDGSMSVNMTQIGRELKMSKATCTRAMKVLDGMGLLKVENVGTAKMISFPERPQDVLQRAWKHMASPIWKLKYVTEISEGVPYKTSGMKALAKKTMISELETDGGYAISKASAKSIPTESEIDRQQYEDFGGEIMEVWNYDPSLLSTADLVDDLSLMLSLSDTADERVQGELEELKSQYGLTEGN